MDTLHKIEYWADRHHPLWLDFIRIALGTFLFLKGIVFVRDIGSLQAMMYNMDIAFGVMAASHYIIFAHTVGGLLIAMGIITRLAVLVNLPVLFGAVFLLRPVNHAYNSSELWLAVLVLLLLIVFLVYGSGKLSVSQYMRTHRMK